MSDDSVGTSAYFAAALRWFHGNDSVRRARALVDGETTEEALWNDFAAFGLADLLALETDSRERARVIADVGRAAGQALYSGPLFAAPGKFVRGTTLADGSVTGWQDAPGTSGLDGADALHDRDLMLLATCARLQGVGERMLEITIEHLSTRRQFGRTLASFQALQHATVDRHCDLTLSGALVRQTVLHWESHGLREAALNALKATVGPAAVAACDHGVQMFGAMGFTHECDVGLYLRHALVLAVRHGTSASHRAAFAARRVDFLPD